MARGRAGDALSEQPRGPGRRESRAAGRLAGLPGVGLYEGTEHSFVTDALDQTGNERAVQEYLGHVSTRRFTKLGEARLAEVVRPRTVH